MTREDLIAIIYNDNSSISCPEYSCDTSEEEASFSKCCMTCAERQLAEYEDKIRADEREKVMMSDYDCLLTCEHIEVIFKSAYDKGRADAIEECIDAIKPRKEWTNNIYSLAILHCLASLEMVKEQSNE